MTRDAEEGEGEKEEEEEEEEEEEAEDEKDTLAPVWVPALLLFITSLTILFSLTGGFYGPLYLAVTCSILFLPEEYSTWSILGDDFRIRRIQRFLV